MAAPRRRMIKGWGELLFTSGLAAAIATVGSYLTDRGKTAGDAIIRRCEIAQAFLSDETPTPYMDELTRRRTTQAAVVVFDRCMKEL